MDHPRTYPGMWTNGELRILATALHDLQRDFEDAKAEGRQFEYKSPFQNDHFRFGPVEKLFPALVESSSYIAEIPLDTLAWPDQPYLAAASGGIVILMSVGRNGKLDITESELETSLRSVADLDAVIEGCRYMPTNGAKSKGDIFRIERGLSKIITDE
ncbi:MAG: hypothetical protein H6751_15305 [Candidatus Omnitrophica bacterium]|nr:hypothetical protein [Candidatus Omnitrophota bacterium]